jgi:multimeric flavodoxin WrbA
MRNAQGIIVGSPVYFGSATPQLMSLLDRAGYVIWRTKEFFSGKIGAPIVVAGRAGHNFTLAQLLLWYFINDMIVVGSTYWNIAVAGSGGTHDIEADTEGIHTVRHFAGSISRLMRKAF